MLRLQHPCFSMSNKPMSMVLSKFPSLEPTNHDIIWCFQWIMLLKDALNLEVPNFAVIHPLAFHHCTGHKCRSWIIQRVVKHITTAQHNTQEKKIKFTHCRMTKNIKGKKDTTKMNVVSFARGHATCQFSEPKKASSNSTNTRVVQVFSTGFLTTGPCELQTQKPQNR